MYYEIKAHFKQGNPLIFTVDEDTYWHPTACQDRLIEECEGLENTNPDDAYNLETVRVFNEETEQPIIAVTDGKQVSCPLCFANKDVHRDLNLVKLEELSLEQARKAERCDFCKKFLVRED